jgi:hypothetical protein
MIRETIGLKMDLEQLNCTTIIYKYNLYVTILERLQDDEEPRS